LRYYSKMATAGIPGIKVNEQNAKGKFPMKKVLPPMYYLCRIKANQCSLMRRRGYILSRRPKETEQEYNKREQEEEEWIACSREDEMLMAKTKELIFKRTLDDAIKNVFNQEYETTVKIWLKTSGRLLPIVPDTDDQVELQVGIFRMENDNYVLTDEAMFSEHRRTIKVLFGNDTPVSSDVVYEDTPHYFVIALASEPDIQQRIKSRDQGVELWFADELMMDPFQHWLTPMHRKLETPELLHLMSNIAMLKDENGKWVQIPNSTITGKENLPVLLETDMAIRFIGANTGDVVYWENPSIIEQLSAVEFGYCRIRGHTIEVVVGGTEEGEVEEPEEEEEESEPDDDMEVEDED